MTVDQSKAFEFVYGSWQVHNTKLRDVADPACDEWLEFDATSEVFPVLAGIGHIDQMRVTDPPDGDPFEGLTLRLYDPAAGVWQIWWSSTRAPGRLDPPVIGTWHGAVGAFECEDEIGGRPLRVRFEWRNDDRDRPTWQQFFSYDGGRTWRANWLMEFRR